MVILLGVVSCKFMKDNVVMQPLAGCQVFSFLKKKKDKSLL